MLQAGERVEIFDKHIREAQKILADYIDPANGNGKKQETTYKCTECGHEQLHSDQLGYGQASNWPK